MFALQFTPSKLPFFLKAIDFNLMELRITIIDDYSTTKNKWDF